MTGHFVQLANFNSHAHVERDLYPLGAKLTDSISTHTLTWSVTADKTTVAENAAISTHTLTWSVT